MIRYLINLLNNFLDKLDKKSKELDEQIKIEKERNVRLKHELEKFKPKGDDLSELISECLLMEREYYDDGVHTKITFPDGEVMWGAERPWVDNKRSLSCIPEGEYSIGYRRSPVVERTSGGDFTCGYEVENIPNRSYIMFHVGNWPLKDSDGCILIGEKGWDGDQPVVWSSRAAFKQFMSKMNKHEISRCIIQTLED